MGSLNGDIIVKRNGRCTSQVSVFNYPEHLNPFYEDDQHKRLKFWTLKKYKDQNRSNSISYSNLKDIWGFKSFRLNKRSSTLGINKTSESPPLLRRELPQTQQQNGYNTLDRGMRSNYNDSTLYGDNFHRNTISRSSFQNLLKQDRMGFNRNDNYRSTMQVGEFSKMRNNQQSPPSATLNRYVYRGSMTPQPLRNLDINDSSYKNHNSNRNNNNNNNNALKNGSSRTSVISTNPFDTEYENDNNNNNDNNINMKNTSGKIIPKKQTPYKKRRAPPPPPSVVSVSVSSCTPTILTESSPNAMNNNGKIDSNELHIAENTDIANLTAEIEHFVEAKNNANIERDKIQSNTAPLCSIEGSNSSDTQRMSSLVNSPTKKKAATIVTTDIIKKSDYDNIKTIEVTNVQETKNDKKDVSDEVFPVKTTVAQKEPILKEKLTNIEIKSDKPPNDIVSHETTAQQQPALARTTTSITDTYTAAMEEIEKPTPIKRKSKVDVERKENSGINSQQLTTFRPPNNNEIKLDKQITAKTSFTLTSPPPKRKDDFNKKNTTTSNEIEYKQHKTEESTLSKLNTTTSTEGGRPLFAEIHKPVRNKMNQKLFISNREELSAPVKPPLPDGSYKKQEIVDERRTNYIKQDIRNRGSGPFVENYQQILDMVGPTIENNGAVNTCKGNVTTEVESIYRHKEAPSKWKESTLAPLESNIPPEKRKSVKDIIESINRSQRILNASANKDFPIWPDRVIIDNNNNKDQQIPFHSSIIDDKHSNLMICENLKMLDESEQKLKQIMNEIESSIQKEQPTVLSPKINVTTRPNNLASSPKAQKTDDQRKIDNNEIIQKCIVIKERCYDSRESSPISSNLDWNPLPKPKRIKPVKEENP